MVEPGLDRHEWETEWQGLEPLIIDSPGEALPEVDSLIERMMRRRRQGRPVVVLVGRVVPVPVLAWFEALHQCMAAALCVLAGVPGGR